MGGGGAAATVPDPRLSTTTRHAASPTGLLKLRVRLDSRPDYVARVQTMAEKGIDTLLRLLVGSQ